jgi:predicted XRE-type DNA-binding protein
LSAVIVTRHHPTAPKKALSQTAAAALLGVTREHLNRVLRGHRTSRRLMKQYRALSK